MKKKPNQCTRQGKSNSNIKSFLSNLKENDIHFEDNQITQCVFLGVLRLKPVPSVFNNNNVPSITVGNKSKRYKNNNSVKEVNKNISSKKDINKVISGKIRKKNPDRIKACVKKIPTKKPVIKIKFNMNKHKKDSDKDSVAVTQDSLTKITPQTMLQNKTITLSPNQTGPSFNPVQNLFDKLKQQMDEKYNRPGSSDVSKELFFSEINVDIQKGARKNKKISKKKSIYERLVMPLLPSSSSFSDNGYHSSTSTNPSDEVIVVNEEGNVDLMFVNTLSHFDSIEKSNNDIILIEDMPLQPSVNEEFIIEDSRSTRTSPRNLQKNNNEEKASNSDHSGATLTEKTTGTEIISSNNSSDKPRKRRTLMPTIPLNFFNTPMLLRSELAQKKENRQASKGSAFKGQKLDNKQEKTPIKQRKDKSDAKHRNSTENLIYEVVKSTTAVPEQYFMETNVSSPNEVIVVENSPPKVEPLIIKLKVSQNKNGTEKSAQEEQNENKNKKGEVLGNNKNLFFPRFLRSDVNQQKSNSDEISEKSSQITENVQQVTPFISPGKISVKPDSFLKENPDKSPRKKLFVEYQEKVRQFEKNINVIKTTVKEKPVEKINTTKKTELTPQSLRRQLRSDISQEKHSVIDSNEDKCESTTVITIKDEPTSCFINSSPKDQPKVLEKSVEEASEGQQGPRQLRSNQSPKKSPESETNTVNVEKLVTENKIIGESGPRQLRSNQAQKNPNQNVITVNEIQNQSVSSKLKDIATTTKNDVVGVKKSKKEITSKPETSALSKDDSKSPIGDSTTNVRRQLRSDLVQKENSEETSKPSDFDNNNFTQKRSKNKKTISRNENLEIDLVDYAYLSVDTNTPRTLRSEHAQKKAETKTTDLQEKFAELPKAQDELDHSQIAQKSCDAEQIIVEESPEKLNTAFEQNCDLPKPKECPKSAENSNIEPAKKKSVPKAKASKTAEKCTEVANIDNTKVNKITSKTKVISPTEKSQHEYITTKGVKNNKKTTNKVSVNLVTKKIKSAKKFSKPIKKSAAPAKINGNLKKKIKNDEKENLIKSIDLTEPTKKNLIKTKKDCAKTKAAVKNTQTKLKQFGIKKLSRKVHPDLKSKNNKPKNTVPRSLRSKSKQPNAATNSLKSEAEPQKKKQDFDEITVVTEKRNKKQKESPVRKLRSSFVPIFIKEEVSESEEKPVAVVEKVVALIHSEPKPKTSEERVDENKEKSKYRILRSQNFAQIENINEIKKVVSHNKEPNKRRNKNDKMEFGISQKSKAITKNKNNKLAVSKTVKSDAVVNKKNNNHNITKDSKNEKVAPKKKILKPSDKLTPTAKKSVVQQVKSKLKTTKSYNPLKKSSLAKKKPLPKKRMINWQNDDIIERIIQELKNTIFNQDSTENKIHKNQTKNTTNNKKTLSKKQKLTKSSQNKKKVLLAKKKLLQTKAALQRKLRSARKAVCTDPDEANTSGGSDSKENNPPKQIVEQAVKEETTIHLVDSYLEEVKENDIEKQPFNKADSIIIINDVRLQNSDEVGQKTLKRKNVESLEMNNIKKRQRGITQFSENSFDYTDLDKKKDVFDFDESDPELPPLRSKSRDNYNQPTGLKTAVTQTTPVRHNRFDKEVAPRETFASTNLSTELKSLETLPLRRNSSTAKTFETLKSASAQIETDAFLKETVVQGKSFDELSEPSTSQSKLLINPLRRKPSIQVPAFDDEGKPRKLYSVIPTPPSPPEPIPPRPNLENLKPKEVPSTIFTSKPEESQELGEKKSPLKQATIIEMFSKVWMKQEKPTYVRDLNKEENIFTNMPPPPTTDPVTKSDSMRSPSPRRDRPEDEDSDNESRREWIPEEYAEYKFKYSAKKMNQYKPLFKCKICQALVGSYYKLLKHRKEHENQDRPYVCNQCGSEFKDVQEFSAHLRVHKGKHPYMCQKCDMGFWTKKAYEAHGTVHIFKKAKQPVKKFRCDVCAKEFSKLCDVERHTRVHTGEKPCVCNICNKRFQQAHNLSKHLLTHLHIKPFVCEICNKQFGRNDVLRRHLLTHSIDKPVKCTVCKKGFIRHSQLLQHMKKKHPEQSIDDLTEQSVEVSEDEDGVKNEGST